MKNVCLITACCLILSSLAFSQTKPGNKPNPIKGAPTTCPNDPVLPSDGIVTNEDAAFSGGIFFYTLNAKGGHSYSIEVWDPVDPTFAVSPLIQLLASDCSTTVSSTNVTNVDPDLSGGFSSRISWVQSSDATLHVSLTNPDQNNSYIYYIRVTDTTLYNPRWSTSGGFNTSWGFTNTTSTDISGTLTIINSDGTVLKTVNGTFKAGVGTFYSATGEGIQAGLFGNAVFTYIGPAGAILADGYQLSGNNSTIFPIVFEGKHSYH
jgi:hypothetical protein